MSGAVWFGMDPGAWGGGGPGGLCSVLRTCEDAAQSGSSDAGAGRREWGGVSESGDCRQREEHL